MEVKISSFPTEVGEQNQAFRFSFVFLNCGLNVFLHMKKREKGDRLMAVLASLVAEINNRLTLSLNDPSQGSFFAL